MGHSTEQSQQSALQCTFLVHVSLRVHARFVFACRFSRFHIYSIPSSFALVPVRFSGPRIIYSHLFIRPTNLTPPINLRLMIQLQYYYPLSLLLLLLLLLLLYPFIAQKFSFLSGLFFFFFVVPPVCLLPCPYSNPLFPPFLHFVPVRSLPFENVTAAIVSFAFARGHRETAESLFRYS